jgi:carbamoyl-phosphate synthase small subunit
VRSEPVRGPRALLVLEDGTAFEGTGWGAEGETFGEAVFNTAMSGYQEVLTDPSYTGQIVTMTAPQQGNYGMVANDAESDRLRVAGFAVREASRVSATGRTGPTLRDALADEGVVGIEGIDTRRLTRHIRAAGAMRAVISTLDTDRGALAERAAASPGVEGVDLTGGVTTPDRYEASGLVGPPQPTPVGRTFRVAAYDFGLKRTILRRMAATGIDATVIPASTPPADVLRDGFDGAFLSNGPGDPAATTTGIEAARGLLGKLPVFGICLGHQLMALALGGRTHKMKFGHRGANQPVQDRRGGAVTITSHNHGFAVDPRGWEGVDGADHTGGEIVRSQHGRLALSHWSLNDQTLEGLRCLDIPAFSVQYHPEAAPGPNDAIGLFAEFRDLMAGR